MNKLKASPGPWSLELKNDRDFYAIRSSVGNVCILAAESSVNIDKQANACLISAAPEMFDKLEVALRRLEEKSDFSNRDINLIKSIDAVLKKARGYL